MTKKITFFIFITALISCGPNGEPGNENENKTVFRYNEMGSVRSLDPAAANVLEVTWLVNQIFNGLVQMNDKLEVIPCIARSWEISPDGKEYVFHLRNDVFFHDNEVFDKGKGRKVTAQDFVFSFLRLSEMKDEQSAKYLLENFNKTDKNAWTGFIAENDSTFRISLKEPFSPFLQILTMQYFSVVPKEADAKYGEEFGRHPVGTGPFMFKKWTDEKLVLVKNENYFETDGENRLPYLDAVSVSFIKDKETAFTNFIKGDFEMISGMETINKDLVLTGDGNLKKEFEEKIILQKCPFLKTDYLGFYLDKSRSSKQDPMMIKEVREAINYGIDRKKIVAYLRNNIGKPATAGFLPAGLPSFNNDKVKGFEFDPEKAAELLKKAGFPNGKGLPEITLNITTQFFEISEAIRENLAQLGMKVKINVNPTSTQNEMIATGQYDFFRKSWVGDFADGLNFFSIFYSKNFTPNGSNYFHFSNSEFDALYEEAMKTSSEKARYEMYYKMDDLLMENAVVVPLFYDEVMRLVQKNVEGFTTNPMNLLNLKKVKIKK